MKNPNKIILYIIFILTFIFPIILPYVSNSKYEDVQASLKEVAYSYYMRGTNIQLNLAKSRFFLPEEATEQNINYLVASSFIANIFQDLLNIIIPLSPNELLAYAKNNLTNPEVIAYADRYEEILEMKVYDPYNEKKYKQIDNPTFEYILSLIKIGDVLVFPGSTIIIYDLIKNEDNNIVDAIFIDSIINNGRHINTKIQKNFINLPNGITFSSPGFSLFWNSNLNNDFEEGLLEGTLSLNQLSKINSWKNINNILYKATQYAILRFINNDTDQNAILNYKAVYNYKGNFSDYDLIELSNKNKDRVKFKH